MDTKGERVSREELMKALQDAMDEGDVLIPGEGEGEALTEGERMASGAEAPKPRRERMLTASQLAFTQGLIQGKTMAQAYRDAYPNAGGSDASIKAGAWKLSRDPRIQARLNDAWGETVEALAEDNGAVKRYVMKQLLALSKGAKQEGSRLKALELMARSAGMFREVEQAEDKTVSADKLRAELAGHLKLIGNIRPLKRTDVASG